MPQPGVITLLFTDLVDSTRLLQTLGDEGGQQLFRAHHKLLSGAVTASGGEELEWLGDGMLASFSSTSNAVRCATSMQQTARRPVSGARLGIRVGINVGEVVPREGGYFGTAVVVARRLCDRASAGQILCSRMVAEVLAGRQTFSFHELGAFHLKGIEKPVDVCEVIYAHSDPAAMLRRTPFVGRGAQMATLSNHLTELQAGRGAVAMVRGEAGIGKSRFLEEFADYAQQRGASVLRGACYDGEWQPAYGPFAEAIVEYARRAPTKLRTILGNDATVIARIAPALQVTLGLAAEPLVLDKEEERVRLFDAVSRFLMEISRPQPLVLMLDDLHWADRGTVALLGRVSHLATVAPIMVIGAYRDAEIDGTHPLQLALASLRRKQNFMNLTMAGLQGDEVAELLEAVGDQSAPEDLVRALREATNGNPLFIREILLHLLEQRKILREGEGWNTYLDVGELDIPEGIRYVIGQRLARLSEETRRLLAVGSAFNGAFSFDVAAAAAQLDEEIALRSIDEALAAQVLRPGTTPDTLDFTHALIRHTLYGEMNPPRRSRMHRMIAEQMERTWGEKATAHAAEVAYQFWRAATRGGSGRGVDYAIAAADNAEAACAHDEVVGFLRIGIDLLVPDDPRRPKLFARLGLVLPWTLRYQEGVQVSQQAAELIRATEGVEAACDFLEKAARAMHSAGRVRASWDLARVGLSYAGNRRDLTWASLREFDLVRTDAVDPNNPGIIAESLDRRELRTILKKYPTSELLARGIDGEVDAGYESRQAILNDPEADPYVLVMMAGELRRGLRLWQDKAAQAEQRGRLAKAWVAWSVVALCHLTLGDIAQVQPALDRATALYARTTGRGLHISTTGVRFMTAMATDEGWEELAGNAESTALVKQPAPENRWCYVCTEAASALVMAKLGRTELALQRIKAVPRALEMSSLSENTGGAAACDAVAVLWLLNRSDDCSQLENALQKKVLAPDFRLPMRDGRLAMARLCALQGRYEEAEGWFARARAVLDEQGARPLRAIADFDQALMYRRRGARGDVALARPYLDTAAEQFNHLGMTGWIQRAAKAAMSSTSD